MESFALGFAVPQGQGIDLDSARTCLTKYY